MEKIKFKIGLIEAIVIVIVMAVLVNLYFSLLHATRVKDCESNLRRLSTYTTMYAWENRNLMPGLLDPKSKKYNGWVTKILPYTQFSDSKEVYSKTFYCLESKSRFDFSISYGYNAALIQSDGTGIDEKTILKPNHVGVLCDAEPTPNEGGIIGTITGQSSKFSVKTVKPVGRHSGGIIVGYADGHSAFVSVKYDENDKENGVNKAFYRAVELGYIKKAGTKGR